MLPPPHPAGAFTTKNRTQSNQVRFTLYQLPNGTFGIWGNWLPDEDSNLEPSG